MQEKEKPIIYTSTKTYTHAQGLSCCFRQWRAGTSHCRFLHGYALEVKIVFESELLDDRNWVIDFGGMKDIKWWLEKTFDHKTLVAADDPHLEHFNKLHAAGIIDMIQVEHVGCEKFAEMILKYVEGWLVENGNRRGVEDKLDVRVAYVAVKEHAGNGATARRVK